MERRKSLEAQVEQPFSHPDFSFSLRRSLRWAISPEARKGVLIGLGLGLAYTAFGALTLDGVSGGNFWQFAQDLPKYPPILHYTAFSAAVMVGGPTLIGWGLGQECAARRERKILNN